jgi:hypothetical protein
MRFMILLPRGSDSAWEMGSNGANGRLTARAAC